MQLTFNCYVECCRTFYKFHAYIFKVSNLEAMTQLLYNIVFVVSILTSATANIATGENRLSLDKKESAGDGKSTVCMPMMFGQEMTPEMKEKIKAFQQGFKETKKFPKVTLSEKQSSWLLSLSTSTSSRISHGKASGQATETKLNVPKSLYYIPSPMRIRKEYRQLTIEERQSFHNALNAMKSFIPDPERDPDTSGYNLLVKMHRYENAPAAHGGAAFLPWHREFLLRSDK